MQNFLLLRGIFLRAAASHRVYFLLQKQSRINSKILAQNGFRVYNKMPQGWEKIKIPANTKQVNIDLYNPEENLGLYYLTFELRLLNNTEEGYEVLYKSDLIKPGQHVQNIELTKSLTSGEYETIIHVQPYKMDEYKTPTNNADMKTMLVVK